MRTVCPMDTGEPIMSDEEKTNEQLLAELVELRQQLVVKQAAERVWQEVLAMRESEDIVEVVAVMWQEMRSLGENSPSCTNAQMGAIGVPFHPVPPPATLPWPASCTDPTAKSSAFHSRSLAA